MLIFVSPVIVFRQHASSWNVYDVESGARSGHFWAWKVLQAYCSRSTRSSRPSCHTVLSKNTNKVPQMGSFKIFKLGKRRVKTT